MEAPMTRYRIVSLCLLGLFLITGCDDKTAIKKGRQFLDMGDISRALVQFENAVSANPKNATAHYLLAKTYCLCDSEEPAIKEYGILSQLNRTLANDTLLRQKLAIYLNTEPYPSTRLTFSKGNDAFPGISYDGKMISFSSKRDGNPELYIMNSDGKEQRRLTKHPAVDYGPGLFSRWYEIIVCFRPGRQR